MTRTEKGSRCRAPPVERLCVVTDSSLVLRWLQWIERERLIARTTLRCAEAWLDLMSDERLTVMQRSAVTLIPGSPITAWRTDVISADCSVGYMVRKRRCGQSAWPTCYRASSKTAVGPIQSRYEPRGRSSGCACSLRKKARPDPRASYTSGERGCSGRGIHARSASDDVSGSEWSRVSVAP